MIDLVWLLPAFPLAGFLVLVVFGRRLGNPLAGWFATAMVAASFVCAVAVTIDLHSQAADDRVHVVSLFTWLPVGTLQVKAAFLVDPLSTTMAPVRHRRRRADPHVLGRLHARRPEVLEVLHLPEPLRVLDADARARREPARHVPRLGGRGGLLVLVGVVLVQPQQRGAVGRQEGLRHDPHRRLLLPAGHVPGVPVGGQPQLPTAAGPGGHPADRHRDGDLPPAVRSVPSASRRRYRCTSGCPTPWKARRRCRR